MTAFDGWEWWRSKVRQWCIDAYGVDPLNPVECEYSGMTPPGIIGSINAGAISGKIQSVIGIDKWTEMASSKMVSISDSLYLGTTVNELKRLMKELNVSKIRNTKYAKDMAIEYGWTADCDDFARIMYACKAWFGLPIGAVSIPSHEYALFIDNDLELWRLESGLTANKTDLSDMYRLIL